MPPSKKFYVSVDVTFNEQESYFTTPYFQGENSIIKDKDGDFLLDLSSLPMSKPVPTPRSTMPTSCSTVQSPVSVSSEPKFESVPEIPENPVSVPVPEILENPLENSKSAIENVRFGKGKVFSRNKTAASESMQVRESNPDPENEVTISNPSLQVETESLVSKNDQDLPITVRKGTRECIK